MMAVPERVDMGTGEVVPMHGTVMPAMSIDDALEQWDQYQALKTKVGKAEDFQEIKGKAHPKKSFVRKAQRFFGVSCRITRDEPWADLDGKVIGWTCSVMATHQGSGLYQEADGSCEFAEKKGHGQATLHNVRSHALTRAKNRAILDLVGFGEVSAEEIIQEKRGQSQRGRPADKTITKAQAEKLVARFKKIAEDQGLAWDELLCGTIAHVRDLDYGDTSVNDVAGLTKDELDAIGARLKELGLV